MQETQVIPQEERAARTDRLVKRAWSLPEVYITLGTMLMLFLLASFTGLFVFEEQLPVAQITVTYLIYLLVSGLITLLNHKRNDSWTDAFGMDLRHLKHILLSPLFYLGALPLLILTTLLWHWILQIPNGMEPDLQDAAKAMTQESSWLRNLYILTAILIAPVFEEIVFRGLVFPCLVKQIGLAGGTLAVSLIFGLLHFHLPSVVPLMLLSAVLCMAYWRTGSLWASIGTHAIFNSVTIVALIIN